MKEEEGDQSQETDDLSDGDDVVDYPPNNYIYRCVDVFFILTGIVTYYLDWVSAKKEVQSSCFSQGLSANLREICSLFESHRSLA